MEASYIVDYTQARIDGRYQTVKEDHGVIGSGKVTHNKENNAIEIVSTEDGKTRKFSMQYREDEARDYVFECRAEDPGEEIPTGFLQELKALLAKYDGSISWVCDDSSDTHGITGDQMLIGRVDEGKAKGVAIDGNHIESYDIK